MRNLLISLQIFRFFSLVLACFLLFPSISQAKEALSESAKDISLPIEWFLDESSTLSLQEVLAPERTFTSLSEQNFPHRSGALWLRLPLNKVFPDDPVLNLNTRMVNLLPDVPKVWLAQTGGDGSPLLSSGTGLYSLPSSIPEGSAIYLKINGLPAPLFEPSIVGRKTISLADQMGKDVLLIVLAVLFFVCLVRGLAERREWRLWAALYAVAICVHTFWGLPETPSGIVRYWDLPGILAPGIAMLLLPHIGRNILQTRDQSRLLDLIFIVLGFVGIACAATPLLPDQAWLIRYLPHWPLFLLLLIPPCIYAWRQKIQGAIRFLLMVLMPPLGILLALPDIQWGMHGITSLLPTIGLTASCLLASLIRSPAALPARSRKTGNRRVGKPVLPQTPGEAAGSSDEKTDKRLPDMLVLDARKKEDPGNKLPVNKALHSTESLQEETGILPERLRTRLTADQVEGILRAPLDTILREITALDQMISAPEARGRLEALGRAGKTLSLLVGHLPESVSHPDRPGNATSREQFDLIQLVQGICANAENLTATKRLDLTWFVAPYLPRLYEGPREWLEEVLNLLVESAVLATSEGSIRIRVQREPESTNAGELLFSISDTGKGTPPSSRTSLAFVRAWELVASEGKSLSLNSSPHGTSVSFGLSLTVKEEDIQLPGAARTENTVSGTLTTDPLRIFVVSGVPANRQLLAYYLDELPHNIVETRSAEEASREYRNAPGALILFADDISEDEIAAAVPSIRDFEGEHNLPLSSLLALAADTEQAERFRSAGCTHVLIKPVARTTLRHLVLRLAPLPHRDTETRIVSLSEIVAPPDSSMTDRSSSAENEVPTGTPPDSGQKETGTTLNNGQKDAVPTQKSGSAPKEEPAPEVPPKSPVDTAGPVPADSEKTHTVGTTLSGFLNRLFGRKKKQLPQSLLDSLPEAPALDRSKISSVGDPRPLARSTAGEPEHPAGPTTGDSPSVPKERRPEKIPGANEPEEEQPKRTENTALSRLRRGERILPRKRQPAPAIRNANADIFPSSFGESVGEPMPVPGPGQTNGEKIVSRAPNDLIEWVGEPMPITKKQEPESSVGETRTPAAAGNGGKTSPVTSIPSRAPIDLVEWVGEPMPIPSKSGGKSKLERLSLSPEKEAERRSSEFPGKNEEIITLTKPLNTDSAEPARKAGTSRKKIPDLFGPSDGNTSPAGSQISEKENQEEDSEINSLLQELDDSLSTLVASEKTEAFDKMEESAAHIADIAEKYKLIALEDLARCIAMSAEAHDKEEISLLVPELATAIARNRDSFKNE